MAMMFGWYEMDLALGRLRDIPPLQGLGVFSGRFPGQRPGFAYELDAQALKGRYEILVPYITFVVVDFVFLE